VERPAAAAVGPPPVVAPVTPQAVVMNIATVARRAAAAPVGPQAQVMVMMIPAAVALAAVPAVAVTPQPAPPPPLPPAAAPATAAVVATVAALIRAVTSPAALLPAVTGVGMKTGSMYRPSHRSRWVRVVSRRVIDPLAVYQGHTYKHQVLEITAAAAATAAVRPAVTVGPAVGEPPAVSQRRVAAVPQGPVTAAAQTPAVALTLMRITASRV
jgi:hypothetical protein